MHPPPTYEEHVALRFSTACNDLAGKRTGAASKGEAQLPFRRKSSLLHIAIFVAAELGGLALIGYLIAGLV